MNGRRIHRMIGRISSRQMDEDASISHLRIIIGIDIRRRLFLEAEMVND